MGTGLGAMVAKLTYGVRKFADLDQKMREIIPPLIDLTKKLIPMIDADTNAFNDYMKSLGMSKGTVEDRTARKAKMQQGLKVSINAPLKTMQLGDQAWDVLCELARYGNIASKSDLQVGARALETGIWRAYQNVLINMTDIENEVFKAQTLEDAESITRRARDKCAEVIDIMEKR